MKNALGKALCDFRKALNKIGYTASNLCIDYPANPKNINDCTIKIYLFKKPRKVKHKFSTKGQL